MKYKAVVIGTSAGGMEALKNIFSGLKDDFKLPIIIVQHVSPNSINYLSEYLKKFTKLNIKEADEKEKIICGNVYIAPPNYHMLVELDESISFTVEPRVSYARPSIDVLLESAAYCYKKKLIGIILTGGNFDGAQGMRLIHEKGGYTIVQNPEEAEVDSMPNAAIKSCKIDFVGSLDEIVEKLHQLEGEQC